MDSSGAVIPHTTVRARHDFIEFEADATTDDEGAYRLRNLPPGVYLLSLRQADGVLTRRIIKQ